mmetsp:Transcript_83429/g.255009  ORF Transcript_83429/g.255009 Transcript_83429/m.255009 type:complete len:231 (-) Transcript_83429:573-1265(-)
MGSSSRSWSATRTLAPPAEGKSSAGAAGCTDSSATVRARTSGTKSAKWAQICLLSISAGRRTSKRASRTMLDGLTAFHRPSCSMLRRVASSRTATRRVPRRCRPSRSRGAWAPRITTTRPSRPRPRPRHARKRARRSRTRGTTTRSGGGTTCRVAASAGIIAAGSGTTGRAATPLIRRSSAHRGGAASSRERGRRTPRRAIILRGCTSVATPRGRTPRSLTWTIRWSRGR